MHEAASGSLFHTTDARCADQESCSIRTPRSASAAFWPTKGAVPARRMGWGEIANGDLIRTAEEAGFGVLITCDRNIRYQQNLAGR